MRGKPPHPSVVHLLVELFLGRIPQKMADNFNGQTLAIAEWRRKTGPTRPAIVVAKVRIQFVLDQAIEGDDKIFYFIHDGDPSWYRPISFGRTKQDRGGIDIPKKSHTSRSIFKLSMLLSSLFAISILWTLFRFWSDFCKVEIRKWLFVNKLQISISICLSHYLSMTYKKCPQYCV